MKNQETQETPERAVIPCRALLDDMLSGIAKATEGLYQARRAGSKLGLTRSVLEIQETIEDLDKSYLELLSFLSSTSNTKPSGSSAEAQS